MGSHHNVQLALSKRAMRDLVVCLALNNRKLREWVQAELAAGVAAPPAICIRPAVEDPEYFSLPLDKDVVMGAWGVAKALEADCGERVTAADVFSVLLTRAARRDVIAIRATRGDDFDFLSRAFADLRSPGVEPRDENVVKKLNSLLEGVECEIVIVLPVKQRNEAAQARQDATREAEQKRLLEIRLAEQVEATEARNRLAKLLAV